MRANNAVRISFISECKRKLSPSFTFLCTAFHFYEKKNIYFLCTNASVDPQSAYMYPLYINSSTQWKDTIRAHTHITQWNENIMKEHNRVVWSWFVVYFMFLFLSLSLSSAFSFYFSTLRACN